MDQYPFEFKFYVVGMEVDAFIDMIEKVGFTEQAKVMRLQFKKQLDEL